MKNESDPYARIIDSCPMCFKIIDDFEGQAAAGLAAPGRPAVPHACGALLMRCPACERLTTGDGRVKYCQVCGERLPYRPCWVLERRLLKPLFGRLGSLLGHRT